AGGGKGAGLGEWGPRGRPIASVSPAILAGPNGRLSRMSIFHTIFIDHSGGAPEGKGMPAGLAQGRPYGWCRRPVVRRAVRQDVAASFLTCPLLGKLGNLPPPSGREGGRSGRSRSVTSRPRAWSGPTTGRWCPGSRWRGT